MRDDQNDQIIEFAEINKVILGIKRLFKIGMTDAEIKQFIQMLGLKESYTNHLLNNFDELFKQKGESKWTLNA